MSKADRSIDGALNQRFGDDSPKVGDWEPSDGGCGFCVMMLAIVLALGIWGSMR